MQPPMDYIPVAESQPAHEKLHYQQQLEPHLRRNLARANSYQDLHHHHHHEHQHQHQHLHLHHHPHNQTAMVGYQDVCDEINVKMQVSPVSFGSQSHLEKEKHGLHQNQCINQYQSMGSRRPSQDALIAAKSHEDTRFPHRTCEDSAYSPTQRETVQFVHEGMYFHNQPSSSATLVQPPIKLLCSIGGKIMARPVDGKLRYCGGETRIIAIDRGLCFAELMARMIRMYGSPLTLKYQLPGEDLDALVSVSSDDDLQNMLDEYDRLVTSSGNSWLRIFLFTSPLQCESISPLDSGLERENCCANVMQHYIGAINGLANNGKITERLADGQLEIGLNDNLHHHSHQKMPLDMAYTTLAGTCFSKPTVRAPSTPSSAPTSPSVASRQAHHKLCGTGDTCSQFPKDQSKCIALMNGLDLSTPEASHGVYMDAPSTLKCDHQSHILVESPRTLHETPFSRGDAMWVRDNEAHSGDPQEVLLHKCERHRGTDPFFMDTWHDVQKPYGLTNSPCEGHCGHHLAAQPVTLFACQRKMEDDFGRVDSFQQHYQSEGHKQPPVLHQSHQAIFPLHREGPARLQRGSGYDLSYQIVDGQGLSPFSQESTHPHAHSAHLMGTIPMYTMGSAPSSPRDFMPSRCSCHGQHSQVHRGISVSLGEHPHSKRPFLVGDQYVRKHGLPLPSRFYDSSNLGTDPAVWHCLPNLGKGFEADEEDQVSCVGKHVFGRSNSRHNLLDCHVKESAAYYGDSHAVMDPLHGHHERGMHHFYCADYNDQKGQHVEMVRGFPVSSEFQSHMGDRATNPRSNELGSANGFTAAGNLTHIMPSQDYIGDSNIERCREGCNGQYFNHEQTELETGIMGVSDSPSKLKSSHVSLGSPTFGHQESDYDLSSTLFSSTDAVAGSLSRPSLEPPIWVGSPPFAENDNLAKERDACASASAFDCTASSMHPIGGTYSCQDISLGSLTGSGGKSPSFRCIDSHTRGGSEGTSGGTSEPNAEHLSFSAVNHVLERSLDKASVSHAHESWSDIDHLGSLGPSQPLPLRSLDPVTLDGSAVARISPIYDQSPISSVDVATFSFAKGEEIPVVNGIINDKEATSQIYVAEQDRTSATINSHSNAKQHYKNGKREADMAQQATCEQGVQPVSEESRSLLQSSSKHSTEKAAYAKGQESEAVPAAQNKVTSEIVQEEQVGGLASPRIIKEDEMELPATQAEAEAVARGLQIIRNDDLEDLKELGSGTYGTVYHGKWRGSDVAIKRIKATCFMGHPSVQERLISDFWKEAGTLSQLHHPNVVAFYGVVPDGPEGTVATVTEYMVNGSLRQVLVKRDRTIDRKKRLLIAMDAAFGMEYLHSKKIVHFDLKSENLLVNMRDAHRPICKVGDLGLSKVKRRTLVSGGVRGTLPWMAPELLSGKTLVTEKVDVYSFGIVMWELLTGEEPYANMHCGTIIGGIVNDTLRPAIPSWCDPSWRELMERCWSGKPADRPDFSTVASELRAIAVSMNIK